MILSDFDLGNLGALVDLAVHQKPVQVVKDICGEFYQSYYYLMYLLSSYLRIGVMVELGVETGRGVGSFAAASRLAVVYGFDTTHRDELNAILATYPNITFYKDPSIPPKHTDVIGKVDVLHIDTEHSYAAAKEEFEQWMPYLSKGAVVLFDDLHAMEDGVLEYFVKPSYPKIIDDRLHPICGYGVLLYGD